MKGLFVEGSFDFDPILAGKLKEDLGGIIDSEIDIDERSKIKKKRQLFVILNYIQKEQSEVQRKYLYDLY